MKLELSKPILYLITTGATGDKSTRESFEFQQIVSQLSSGIEAGIHLIQIREKKLTVRVLFELTSRAVELARGSSTQILVNDRADVARAAGAAGVHLTTRSLEAGTIRKMFGGDFLVGASTHSLAEAQAARDNGADFVVFGPVFATESKEKYGPPVGLEELTKTVKQLQSFPVLALGGLTKQKAAECLRAGASGVAGISLFSESQDLRDLVATMKLTKESRSEIKNVVV